MVEPTGLNEHWIARHWLFIYKIKEFGMSCALDMATCSHPKAFICASHFHF